MDKNRRMAKRLRGDSCDCLLPGRLELRPAIPKPGKQRIRQWTLATGGLSLMVVMLKFWESEEYHSSRNSGEPIVVVLRYMMLVLAGLQLLLLTCIHQIAKRRNWSFFLLELLITVPVPLPYLDHEWSMSQLGEVMVLSLDDILVPFTCLRLYHLAKSLQYFSYLSADHTDFQIDLHKVPSHPVFLIKALLHYRSIYVVAAVILTNVVVTGLLLRVFERTVIDHSEQLEYIWNGLWVTEVSDSTIGYGDIVPTTHIGRGLISASILLGIVTISYIVGWICNITSLHARELRLFAFILAKRFSSRELSQAAARVIQAAWKLHKKRQKGQTRIQEVVNFSRSIHKFKFQHSRCKAKSEPTFRDQLFYFDKAIRPRIFSITTLLPTIHHSISLVTTSPDQALYLEISTRVEEVGSASERLERTEGKHRTGAVGGGPRDRFQSRVT